MTFIKKYLPKSLYGRAFLIIVLPILLMQSVVTYVFFDRHWEEVTANLAAGVAGEIATLIDIHKMSEGGMSFDDLSVIAKEQMDLSIRFRPERELPTGVNRSFYAGLDRTLRRELSARIAEPFWFDTTRYPDYVEVQVKIDDGVISIFALRERVFATNGHIFLLGLIVATITLVSIALVFLRNQVRPIQRLAHAAEAFGRGRDAPEFRPAGAAEVRQAARAFIGMRSRIRRHIHQRTSLLAGVGHDLRTPLTRMKLALAMIEENEDVAALKSDVDEMERMLEEYLAFARGQGAEEPEIVDLNDFVEEIRQETERAGRTLEIVTEPELTVAIRRNALKRAVTNLVSNALAHAQHVRLTAIRSGDAFDIAVDDNGPGIAPELYEEAFKPFNRLDEARNQNKSGVGLGLAVARDTARSHGGDVVLTPSKLGGLRAMLRIPA
ncbi:MAG: ATP-binding protein [Pseudomonadota bacterium]